jgi:predicted nucleic acid-binding protein
MGMIIDTNALSAFFDGEKGVVEKLGEADGIYLPVIVMGEYRFGLRGSRLRAPREAVLETFVRSCTVLPVLESTTSHYATIRNRLRQAGTPIPENDIWIAALAVEHHLPVLSADAHFDCISGITRIDW